MASTTRQSRKEKAITASTLSKPATNHSAMDNEEAQLHLDLSQQPAITHSLCSDPELHRGLEDLNVADFLSYPLVILETALSPLQARAGLVPHDPSKADFKLAYAGNLALTDFIKSQYHKANITRM